MSSAEAYADGPIGPRRTRPTTRRRQLPRGVSRQQVVDALWVLFIVGASSPALLFGIPTMERYFWLVADVVVLVFLLRDYRPFLSLALQNKILMSWPALACLSTLWSFSPGTSLYQGLQLLMTIMVGFLFCLHSDRDRILKVVFTGLLICMVGSLCFTVLNPGAAIGAEGWTGAYPHKNMLGGLMAVLIFTCACLLLSGWRPLLTSVTLFAAIFTLLMSQSGTALLATVATLAPITLAFCLRSGRSTFSLGIGLTLLLATATLALVVIRDIDLFKVTLNSLGKDATLTGRTFLWDFGLDTFMSRPWLGYGYKGYWEGQQTTVLYLRYLIGQDLWFFHNNFIEVAVAFGVLGPVLLAAGILNAFAVTIRNFLLDHRYVSLWFLLFVIFVTIDAMAEFPLFMNHGLWQFLFVVALASRIQPDSAARARGIGGGHSPGRIGGSQ